MTDFGCEHSFARANESVQEHYGFKLSTTVVRQCTLTHAQRAKVRQEKEYKESFRTLPAQGPGHIIAEADGTMICTVKAGSSKGKRPREWKEIRLLAAQAFGSSQTKYAVTFGSVEQAGRRWGHCTKAAGWGRNSQIHAVGDGAEWIRLQCKEVFQKQGQFLCDFYHVSEYLAQAAPTCRESNPDQWCRTQQKRLRRGAVDLVIETLAQHLEPVVTPDEEAPVRNAHRYLTNRVDCLALRQGLPIGVLA